MGDLALGEQEVRGEDHRRDEREHDPSPSSETPLHSSTISERPASESASASPDARAHALVPERARADRDEQRAEVLDQERDADREPVNREEVEELHERDADDAEDREPQQARGDRRAVAEASG